MVFTTSTKEETRLTHVKVEAFQTTITKADNGVFFTYVTFGLMFGR